MRQDQPLQIVYSDETLSLVGRQSADRPLENLRQLAKLAVALEKGTRDAVRRSRDAGHSWVDLAAALKMSEQATRERFEGDQ